MGKIILALLFVSTVGCSAFSGTPLIPENIDAQIPLTMLDSGPPCSPGDLRRLNVDFQNCGSCGSYCDPSNSNRCSGGICLCGDSVACAINSDCRMGSCVRADRLSECSSQEDCNREQTSGNQECILDITSGRHFCVDVCEFDNECPAGFACIEGACTFVTCAPEGCDDIDNDCDGEVDENSDSSGPLSRWCYSGPDIEHISSPCRRGSQTCQSGGLWSQCSGEISPKPEIGLLACNGLDDNCDGCIDGVATSSGCSTITPSGFDIVYLIDISGSMSSSISAVITATSTFSAIFSDNPDFRFGLILVSGSGARDGRAFVELDFTNFTTFNMVLSRIRTNGGSSEPTWDAVYESVTGEIAHGVDIGGDGLTDVIDETEMGLSWRDDSIRLLFMFADEEAQTTRTHRGLSIVEETSMCSSLSSGETLTLFGTSGNRNQFDECSTFYLLSSDPSVMVDRLRDSIIDPCL